MAFYFVNMRGLKIISILLIFYITQPCCSSTISPPQSPTAQPRADSFDEILRPPPPPPGLINLGSQPPQAQRFQRQNNQFRQPQYPSSQGSYGSSQFNNERYPIIARPSEPQSFFQKVSSWLFSDKNNGSPSDNYGPPPSFRSPQPFHALPSLGPPPTYRAPPPTYGAPSSTYGAPPSNSPPPTLEAPPHRNPLPTYGAPPPYRPVPTYGAPPSRGPPIRQSQYPKKKDCNHCNQFPWIPVLRYQSSRSQQQSGDKVNFNTNILSNNPSSNTGPQNNLFEPAKLSLPVKEPSKPYLPPKQSSDNLKESLRPPTTIAGKPFSLSQVSLQSGAPTSVGNNLPITNSYGTPIPANTYGSPAPKPFDDGRDNDYSFDQYGNTGFDNQVKVNKDALQNLESNRISLITKPNHKKVESQTEAPTNGSLKYKNKTKSVASESSPLEHNDDPFSHSVYPVSNIYDSSRGVQVLQPIPLPNLSSIPIPPIFNARPFRNEYTTGHKNIYANYDSSTVLPSTRLGTNIPLSSVTTGHRLNKFGSSTYSNPSTLSYASNSESFKPVNNQNNFQLLPSVPLAEFTSSIDYPITIVQSPLLEIDTSPQHNGHTGPPTEQSINLNTYPIIVQNESTKNSFDSYSAASGGNDHDTNNEENVNNNRPIKSQQQFLPTPLSFDPDIIDSGNRLQSISYSYIDQSFTNHPSSTPIPLNHKPEHGNQNSIQTQTLDTIDSPLLYLKPSIPHKDSTLFNTNLNNDKENSFHLENVISSTVSPQTSSTPAPWNSGFRFLNNGGYVQGRWPPPVTDFNGLLISPTTKKPKRIQIIIPYTSNVNPSPFTNTNNLDSSTGWVPMTDDLVENHARKVPEHNAITNHRTTNSIIDYHESSESKIVTASTPSFDSTKHNEIVYPKYEASVKTTVPPLPNKETKSIFDIMKLQQNIDEWTAQEYSKVYKRQQKSSTISQLKRSKKIPEEYFTTMPSQRKPAKSFLSTINELNASFLDNEAAGSIQHSVETDVYNDTAVLHVRNELYDPNILTFDSKNTYYTSTKRTPKTTNYIETTRYIETTTITPKTTTKHSWEKIQTSISPLTKEKIYVVTPLPWNPVDSVSSYKNRNNTNITTAKPDRTTNKDTSRNLSFKSPRFLVRPTPGPTGSQKETSSTLSGKLTDINKSGLDWLHSINNLEETTTVSNKGKGFFGLSSVTAYTPPDSGGVHTYSGHSKVVSVVTPSSLPKMTGK